MSNEVYTSEQLIVCLTKSGYQLVQNPRRGRYYFEHPTRKNLRRVIVPVGRTDFTAEYIKLLFKDTGISFGDFKRMAG